MSLALTNECSSSSILEQCSEVSLTVTKSLKDINSDNGNENVSALHVNKLNDNAHVIAIDQKVKIYSNSIDNQSNINEESVDCLGTSFHPVQENFIQVSFLIFKIIFYYYIFVASLIHLLRSDNFYYLFCYLTGFIFSD